jgi:hypothetical protein
MRRPVAEGFAGADVERRTGRRLRKLRNIDRPRDEYLEVVTDPDTGEVVHYCREPLSQHRGHGSAKRPGGDR